MAYDKQKIFEDAKAIIENNYLIFVEEVCAFLPIAKKTFYEWYPVDSNECNELKELLEANKVKKKINIREKLMKGEKAAELLSYYRLICTSEERQMLNQQYIDHTTKGDKVEQSIITTLTAEQLKESLKK